MKLEGEDFLLRIHSGELDKHDHLPLSEAIVLKALTRIWTRPKSCCSAKRIWRLLH
jgi:hypothetical protein